MDPVTFLSILARESAKDAAIADQRQAAAGFPDELAATPHAAAAHVEILRLVLFGGVNAYYLHKADSTVPPRHAPRRDDEYSCPSWLPTTGKFNWGIIGASGVGKSTLINTLRGLRANAEGAACVSVATKENTMEPASYSFAENLLPNLEKIIIFDLPSAGAESYSQNSYIKDMGLRHFDAILIVTASVFTEVDKMLMSALRRFRVPVFMIRNKVDVDIDRNLEDHKDEQATLAEIRECMAAQDINDHLYLIAAGKYLDTNKAGGKVTLDFELLMNDVLFEMCRGRTQLCAPLYWNDRMLEGKLLFYDFPKLWVSSILHATDHCNRFRNSTLVSVKRVENPVIYKRYFEAKERIIEQHHNARRSIPALSPPVSTELVVDRFVNEIYAWHGTTAHAVSQILNEGFDERVAGITRNIYGSGNYFSSESCDAVQYGTANTNGCITLLLCQVVLGEPVYLTETISPRVKTAPLIGCTDGANCQHHRADSVVANSGVANYGTQVHREFILYDHGQAYPKFVVEIKM